MRGYLSNNQIQYVLYHLYLYYDFPDKVKFRMCFVRDANEAQKSKDKIFFMLSEQPLWLQSVRWDNDIPILFPDNKSNDMISLENGNLIFHDDIIKSCFYLLSGYQEYGSENRDHFNRFKYSNSVQNKLGIIHKPIVNYYFEIIVDNIQKYYPEIEIRKKELSSSFVFFLSHDIDNVDFYTINRFLYKIKEIFFMVKTPYTFKANIIQLTQIAFQLLLFSKKENPTWNFPYLRRIERKYAIKSTFYFLTKGVRNHDSRYTFDQKRIIDFFEFLNKEKCEIGIHGTVESFKNEKELERICNELRSVSPQEVRGIRQHRLLYELPETALIQKSNELIYDSTLSFAGHEGFRNSFCLPFKLFDFENDRMIDFWQIPLVMMDVTLYKYRNLDNAQVLKIVKQLISEIKRFNGVFSLLWHNDFFNELTFPGINKTYQEILQYTMKKGAESMTGTTIINRIEKQKDKDYS
jgi:peptidoglycan/xylan/chitin deacetylase (PgdA/CDA1 family)